jgi:hypothetical protein
MYDWYRNKIKKKSIYDGFIFFKKFKKKKSIFVKIIVEERIFYIFFCC